MTLHTLGLFLEERSKGQMSSAIEKLVNLAPKTARVIRNGVEQEITVDEVALGDVIRVRPGESMPVDGVVVEGRTSVDESMLTGEVSPWKRKVETRLLGLVSIKMVPLITARLEWEVIQLYLKS